MSQNQLTVSGSLYDLSGYQAIQAITVTNPNLSFTGGVRTTLVPTIGSQNVSVPANSFGCLVVPKNVPATTYLAINTVTLSIAGFWVSTWDTANMPNTLTLTGTGSAPSGQVEFIFF